MIPVGVLTINTKNKNIVFANTAILKLVNYNRSNINPASNAKVNYQSLVI